MGSGMVPFERALMSSCRASIVTFTPSPPQPKISPCSPGSRWVAFGLRRAKVLG